MSLVASAASAHSPLAQAVVSVLGARPGAAHMQRFPDGELQEGNVHDEGPVITMKEPQPITVSF